MLSPFAARLLWSTLTFFTTCGSSPGQSPPAGEATVVGQEVDGHASPPKQDSQLQQDVAFSCAQKNSQDVNFGCFMDYRFRKPAWVVQWEREGREQRPYNLMQSRRLMQIDIAPDDRIRSLVKTATQSTESETLSLLRVLYHSRTVWPPNVMAMQHEQLLLAMEQAGSREIVFWELVQLGPKTTLKPLASQSWKAPNAVADNTNSQLNFQRPGWTFKPSPSDAPLTGGVIPQAVSDQRIVDLATTAARTMQVAIGPIQLKHLHYAGQQTLFPHSKTLLVLEFDDASVFEVVFLPTDDGATWTWRQLR